MSLTTCIIFSKVVNLKKSIQVWICLQCERNSVFFLPFYSVSCLKDRANVHSNTYLLSIWFKNSSCKYIYILKRILKSFYLHLSELNPEKLSDFFPDTEVIDRVRLGSNNVFSLFLFYFLCRTVSQLRLIFVWSQKVVMYLWAIELYS